MKCVDCKFRKIPPTSLSGGMYCENGSVILLHELECDKKDIIGVLCETAYNKYCQGEYYLSIFPWGNL